MAARLLSALWTPEAGPSFFRVRLFWPSALFYFLLPLLGSLR